MGYFDDVAAFQQILMDELKCKKDKKSNQFELYTLLAVDFVPKLEAEFEAAEKRRVRMEKWAAMPRRVSSRAAKVMEKKAEDEKNAAIALTVAAEAEDARVAELRRKEDQKNQRARADRAAAREEKMEILRAERQQRRSAFGEEVDTQWYRSAKSVLRSCVDHPDSSLFRHPVEEDDAPDYYQVITHPTDLATIGSNLEKEVYAKKEDFAVEVYVMFDNCRDYNKRNVPMQNLAKTLEEYFNKRMARSFKGYMSRTVRKAMAAAENPFVAEIPESCVYSPSLGALSAMSDQPKVPRRELVRGEDGNFIRYGGLQNGGGAVVTDDEDYEKVPLPRANRKQVTLTHIETGVKQVFDSKAAACRHMGGSKTLMYKVRVQTI